MTAFTISAAEFAKIYRERGQVELIDVRTPAEFREVHVEFARNVPLEQFQPAELMRSLGDGAEASAVRRLPAGRPRPTSLPGPAQGRVHKRFQHRGRHGGLH